MSFLHYSVSEKAFYSKTVRPKLERSPFTPKTLIRKQNNRDFLKSHLSES